MHLRLFESVNRKINDLKNQPILTDVFVYFEKKKKKTTFKEEKY